MGDFMKMFLAVFVVLSVAIAAGKCVRAQAQVHHVGGGDGGWHPESDLRSWSSGRAFRVGDKLWFSYIPLQESVVELQSMEEYLSCDLTNPIRMFTDGWTAVPLEEEKDRYFASGSTGSCKDGLKLHVEVLPKEVEATGPTPSASANISGLTFTFVVGLFLCILGL